jgi:hypothetical protein
VLGNRGGVDSGPCGALGVRGKVGRRGREQEKLWEQEVGEESDKGSHLTEKKNKERGGKGAAVGWPSLGRLAARGRPSWAGLPFFFLQNVSFKISVFYKIFQTRKQIC